MRAARIQATILVSIVIAAVALLGPATIAKAQSLETGATAIVSEETPLRGTPEAGGEERAVLAEGTIVKLKGESIAAGETTWWPVIDLEGDQPGWVDGAALTAVEQAPNPRATPGAEEEFMTYDYPFSNHSSDPIAYTESPPVGGEHDPVWQTCGFYDEPIRSEHAVHSLEHGAIWLTYQPDLAPDEIDELQLIAEGSEYILVSPYEDQESPIVATAWNNQLKLISVHQLELDVFIRYFVQGPQTLEPGAPCLGGTSETAPAP